MTRVALYCYFLAASLVLGAVGFLCAGALPGRMDAAVTTGRWVYVIVVGSLVVAGLQAYLYGWTLL